MSLDSFEQRLMQQFRELGLSESEAALAARGRDGGLGPPAGGRAGGPGPHPLAEGLDDGQRARLESLAGELVTALGQGQARAVITGCWEATGAHSDRADRQRRTVDLVAEQVQALPSTSPQPASESGRERVPVSEHGSGGAGEAVGAGTAEAKRERYSGHLAGIAEALGYSESEREVFVRGRH